MSTCWIENVAPEAACSCGNCDWTGPASALDMISDIEQRIDAGDTVPAGQCPVEDCGALAYLVEDPAPPPVTPAATVRAAIAKLREARQLLRTAGARRAALYVARATKSAEGAERHAHHVTARQIDGRPMKRRA